MITSECRPRTFDEMAGQKLAKLLLQNIVNNPEGSPKTLIFYGAYGTGKTTSARVFARALNCEGHGKKPCMKCANCLSNIDESSYYREYDSSIMGKVDKIRELRDTFYVNSSKGWQVIVFDEVHLVSSVAQGALLKILEEAPPRTFFVLCLDGKTRVFTQRGMKEICDVKSGDLVATSNGMKKVKNLYYNGKKEVFRVKTDMGYSVSATDNHMVKVFDGLGYKWKKVKDLISEDYLPIRYGYSDLEDNHLSLDECEFLGRLVGDGYWNTQKDRSHRNLGILFNNKEWGYGRSLLERSKIKYSFRIKESVVECSISKSNDFYEKYGLVPYDNGEKIMPSVVWSMSRKQVSYFFKGWCDADGGTNGVLYCSNEKLILELQELLLSVGKISRVKKVNVTIQEDSKTTGVKSGSYVRYELYVRKRDVSTIPWNDKLAKYLSDLNVDDGKLKYHGRNKKAIVNIKQNYIEQSDLEELKGNVFYSKIDSVVSEGIVDVYDIEVPDGHEFIAQGITVHNCTTDPDKLLNTIKSRSLEVKFEAVPTDEVIKNVKGICEKRDLKVSDEIISLIAKKSKGHMRDAHKYIDQLVLVGEDGFKEVFKSCRDAFYTYFEAMAQKNRDKVFQAIQEIMQFPLAESKEDYQEVVLSLTKQMVDIEQEERCRAIVQLFGSEVLRVVKVCIADWVLDGFSSDMELQTTLLCVYQMVTQSMSAKGPARQTIYDRAGRR